jgi:hypothetical protein
MEIFDIPPHLKSLYTERDRRTQMLDAVSPHAGENMVEASLKMDDAEATQAHIHAHNSREVQFARREIFRSYAFRGARVIADGTDPNTPPVMRIRVDDPWFPEFWVEVSVRRDELFTGFMHQGKAPPSLCATGRLTRALLKVHHATADPDWPYLSLERKVNARAQIRDTALVCLSPQMCMVCVRDRDFPNFELDIILHLD